MKSLLTISEASTLIKQGQSLLLAGDEALLRQLPKGKWIGGTIPYFMTEDGGTLSKDRVFVTALPQGVQEVRMQAYDAKSLPRIPQDYPENGVSFIIIPGFSEVHQQYAENCSTWNKLFDQPLVGWIAGFDLNKPSQALVFNGQTGEVYSDRAVVMHASLPAGKVGKVEIVNLFSQGEGDRISFFENGFSVRECLINGKRMKLSEYIKSKDIDTKLPLVANYMGANINVSIQNVDEGTGTTTLYAPVFKGVEYRIAKPVSNYEADFKKATEGSVITPVFSCNCILNYLYAGLEGKKTGNVTGPITFGEIAYMLLNQTMVYVSIENT